MALAVRAAWQVGEFDTQAIANTAWAFATVAAPDEQLFVRLAAAAERRVSELSVPEFASTAWAFTTVNHSHEKLLASRARAENVVRELGERG